MSGPLSQVVFLVFMTHAFRTVSRAVGPRRGGLLLGLPSTTALILFWSGRERGLAEALGTAEASLLGLVAAVAVPLAYDRWARKGWGLPTSPLAAVVTYLSAAAIVSVLTGSGPAASALFALVGVSAAALVAGFPRGPDEPRSSSAPGGGHVPTWVALALRTAVPLLSLAVVTTVRVLAGPERAGLFLTFPGMSLAVLVTTHVESGPRAACRMARALPAGNLGMVAFLTVFRFACPGFGLALGTAAGMASALSALVLIDSCSRAGGVRWPRAGALARLARAGRLAPWPLAARWAVDPGGWVPAPPRGLRGDRRTRFAPLVEALAG